ncbi:DUF4421 domain-containing protein [Paraflavitalea pollutisoli]|uniref:DUF4421 domain-containing protein n=1 Tax=Paraflavitalea pollutisoli TaxID=3034143 RepID=UPI0023ED0595|nr:DUF4421 domain-containing protein [Paraflavitalea sp. H1-2-19X]
MAQSDTSQRFNRAYYESYTDQLTSRFYFSQKYTSLWLRGADKDHDLQYRPNTTLNMGVGATYGWFTLNLAYGFDFLNRVDEAKGKTRYLDLQSHVYTRKMSIDLFGQFYKGFYGYPKSLLPQENGDWYVRPDLKVRHFGGAGYYILNWKRFSMRAAMLQNEWQKRSAGSLLIGAEMYFGQNKGDSSLVPSSLAADYEQAGVTKMHYYDIGPGIGYAYTLVINSHFYAMAGATASFPLSFHSQVRNGEKEHKVSISPDLLWRVGAGYNSDRFHVSVLWVNSSVQTRAEKGDYSISTGNVRAIIGYRFVPGAKLKRQLKFFSVKQP